MHFACIRAFGPHSNHKNGPVNCLATRVKVIGKTLAFLPDRGSRSHPQVVAFAFAWLTCALPALALLLLCSCCAVLLPPLLCCNGDGDGNAWGFGVERYE